MLELELHTHIAFALQTSPSSCYVRSKLCLKQEKETRDVLFLIAGVPPILRRRDFGAYQSESKDFWEGRQRLETRGGCVSGRYIALRVVISSFLVSVAYDGPSVSQNRKVQRTHFHVSACRALPLSDSIRSIDFVSETL